MGFPLPGALTGGPEAQTATPAPAAGEAAPATAATAARRRRPPRRRAASRPPTAAAEAEPPLAPVPTANRFDGRRAFALLREQVVRYRWRPAGSQRLRRLAVRLRELLPRGRFESIPGHAGLRNVVGSIPGRGKAIVVGAHYDVEARPIGFVGANDGAAGTAAVVELARSLARAPRSSSDRPVRFVLFDGEEEPAGCAIFIECGLRGSKAYAARHGRDVRSLVLLDYIAEREGLSFPRESESDTGAVGEAARGGARRRGRVAVSRRDGGRRHRRSHAVRPARDPRDRRHRLRLPAGRHARRRPRRGVRAQPRRRRRGRAPARSAAAPRTLSAREALPRLAA